MVKLSILPREEKFFELLEQGTANMVKAAYKLQELLDKWENAEALVAEINEIEHQSDSITHEIIDQLRRTFITPFDREDISLMASSIDDVTDLIQAAADAMLIYKIGKPKEKAKDLTSVIVKSTEEVQQATLLLRHRREFKQMLARCVEINRLENVSDRIYRSALGELFDGNTDIADIIKWREIYGHIEGAADRCEDLANVMEGIATKHG